MDQSWAEDVRAGVNATKLLRGTHRVDHVHALEVLAGNFVVVVYLTGFSEPCVLGDKEGTQAWLDARGLKAEPQEVTGPDADRVAEDLFGLIRRTYSSREEPR